MRKPSLTAKTKRIQGQCAIAYAWRGKTIDIFNSALTAMLVIELFADEELDGAEKSALLVRMIFPHPEQAIEACDGDITELLCDALWDEFGLDITADKIHASEYQPPVFDFDQDAARIKASLLQCYGINWDDAAQTTSYVDLCALLGSLTESGEATPFKQAIYFRTAKPPKATKYNRQEREAFNDAQKHYALTKNHVQSANDVSADMFAAAKRAAQRGQ